MLRGRTGKIVRKVDRFFKQPSTQKTQGPRPGLPPARRKSIAAWRGRGEGSFGAPAASEIPREYTRALQLANAAAATSYLIAQRAKGLVPSPLWCFAEAYARSNTERPFVTRALTTGFLAGMGDVMAQFVQRDVTRSRNSIREGGGSSRESQPWYDPQRTLVMASWGTIASGPFNHFWYMWLDRSIALPRLAHSVGLKIVLDHVVYFPVLVGFFAWTDFFRGRAESASDAVVSAVFNEQLMPLMRANVVAWTGVHMLTFTMIPAAYHVLWVSVASLFWSGYCSSVSED